MQISTTPPDQLSLYRLPLHFLGIACHSNVVSADTVVSCLPAVRQGMCLGVRVVEQVAPGTPCLARQALGPRADRHYTQLGSPAGHAS